MPEIAFKAGVLIGFGLEGAEVHYSLSVSTDRPEPDTTLHRVLQAGEDITGSLSDAQVAAIKSAITNHILNF